MQVYPDIRTQSLHQLAIIRRIKEGYSQKENHEHAEHLSNQPAIARYSGPVLQQLSLGALHVVYYILRVRVDPLNHLALF